MYLKPHREGITLKQDPVPAKIRRVPRQPRIGRRYHSLAFMDLQWEVGEEVAPAVGTSRNRAIEDLYDWFMRVPGAKLPERPPAELIKQATAKWHARQNQIRDIALTLHCDECGVDEGRCITGKRKIPTETIHKPRLERATAIVDQADNDAS